MNNETPEFSLTAIPPEPRGRVIYLDLGYATRPQKKDSFFLKLQTAESILSVTKVWWHSLMQSIPVRALFQRKTMVCRESVRRTLSADRALATAVDYSVLVINSSQEMAKEITMQLTLSLPGCSITYAPTLELARWILSRRKMDLVVSNAILPDGSISRLQDVLQKLDQPPDLVVVGNAGNSHMLDQSGYRMTSARKIGTVQTNNGATLSVRQQSLPSLTQSIKSLGADIRNDLNNPLQEIVAMVFVAKAIGGEGKGTNQALEAIDRAANNMAQVVKGLEDKIRAAVS